jgi:hypothetical protein
VLAAHATGVDPDGFFTVAQLAPLVPASLQKSPHMGTDCPSGNAEVVLFAVKFTDCAKHAALARRVDATNPVLIKIVLSVLALIAILLVL